MDGVDELVSLLRESYKDKGKTEQEQANSVNDYLASFLRSLAKEHSGVNQLVARRVQTLKRIRAMS